MLMRVQILLLLCSLAMIINALDTKILTRRIRQNLDWRRAHESVPPSTRENRVPPVDGKVPSSRNGGRNKGGRSGGGLGGSDWLAARRRGGGLPIGINKNTGPAAVVDENRGPPKPVKKTRGGDNSFSKPPNPTEKLSNRPEPTDVIMLDPTDFQKGFRVQNDDPGMISGDDILLKSGHFEGDIDLRGKPIEYYVNQVIPGNPKLAADVQYNAIRGEHYRWPSGEIPFSMSSAFTASERAIIASAIDDYTAQTCIRFKPRTVENDYVYIMKGTGCYSSVGRTGGWQELSLGDGCVTKGITLHEMMHAIGFYHEQSRTDRDQYVTINFGNVQTWAHYNFNKYSVNEIDDLGTQYDFGSIMHYGSQAFTKAWGSKTIIPKYPNQNANIGQRRGLSTNDKYKINLLYKCPTTGGRGGVTPAPTQGSCVNRNAFCDSWALHGHCRINPSYMNSYCSKACRQCQGSSCSDTKEHCGYWQRTGECRGQYIEFMSRYCKKSCALC